MSGFVKLMEFNHSNCKTAVLLKFMIVECFSNDIIDAFLHQTGSQTQAVTTAQSSGQSGRACEKGRELKNPR